MYLQYNSTDGVNSSKQHSTCQQAHHPVFLDQEAEHACADPAISREEPTLNEVTSAIGYKAIGYTGT